MAITRDDIPEPLISSYKEGKCGFFVGAGLSMASGFDDWKSLLENMIAHSEASHLLPEAKAEECRKLLEDSTKYLMLAQEMKEVLGVEFKSFIERIFLDATKEPSEAHDVLVNLANKKFLITTNYDMLIENAFVNHKIRPRVYKYYEAHAIQRSLFNREFFILKAHGDAETAAEKIILTEKDYRAILYKEPGYQSALQSIFTMYSVIFIGSSLIDPELMLMLNYINSAFPEGGIPHYALMGAENIGATEKSRWLKDYNIRIVPVSKENDYADIVTFLKLLQSEEG